MLLAALFLNNILFSRIAGGFYLDIFKNVVTAISIKKWEEKNTMNSSNWNKLEIRKAKAVLEYFGFIHTELCDVVEDLHGPCI